MGIAEYNKYTSLFVCLFVLYTRLIGTGTRVLVALRERGEERAREREREKKFTLRGHLNAARTRVASLDTCCVKRPSGFQNENLK